MYANTQPFQPVPSVLPPPERARYNPALIVALVLALVVPLLVGIIALAMRNHLTPYPTYVRVNFIQGCLEGGGYSQQCTTRLRCFEHYMPLDHFLALDQAFGTDAADPRDMRIFHYCTAAA